MPLFFAYYRVLANVIELRQAHWYWLHDLSVPDPIYILPGIILVSMFLVQFITPSPGMDPNQRRMMAIMMPVIFGFSMSHFASGLALYWCTGNLINLGIQLAINRSKMGQEMHEIAAKRQARKLGASGAKTIQGSAKAKSASATKAGCPILSTFFVEWVGNLNPRPARSSAAS